MHCALYTVFVVCCVIHCSSGGTPNATTRKLYLLTLLPYPNPTQSFVPAWEGGPNIVPALDLAARHVNQREGFLDGYELELIHKDGGCDIGTTTLTSLVRGLFTTNNSVVGLIGPGCSPSALAVLSTINTQNRTSLIAVHGAGSLAINRAAFPHAFGTLGSSYAYVDTMFALMNHSGWRNIAIMVDAAIGPIVNEVLTHNLPRAFPDGKILFSGVVYDYYIPLTDLVASKARVVFIIANTGLSQTIMCLALHSNMLYPACQWIFVGQTFEQISVGTISFNYNGEMYNCSNEEVVHEALHGSIFLNHKLIPFKEDEPTFSGLSHREYLEEYSTSVVEHNSDSENGPVTVSIWATYFYDAVWTWAIVLDNVTKSNTFQIEDYQFDQPNTALIEQFEQIDFQGVSGRIKFDSNTGSVERSIDLFQVFNGTAEYVAYYNAGAIVNRTDRLKVIDDSFPIQISKTHPAVAVAITLPLIVQIVIIIATHIAVIAYRNAKSIKASSPNITQLTYIGLYLLATGFCIQTVTYVTFLKSHEGDMCQAVWGFLYPFGFTLAFGTTVVKTWRLYRIFLHRFNPGGKFISEPALVCIVCVLLSVNIVISIIWTSIDPFINVLIINMDASIHRECDCTYYFAWFSVLWGYIFLQLAILLTLVCLTRKIKKKSFETVRLQVLIYGTVGVFGLGATLYYFAVFQRLDTNVTYAIIGTIINVLVALYLSCVFLPPVVPLMRQKWHEIRKKRAELI